MYENNSNSTEEIEGHIETICPCDTGFSIVRILTTKGLQREANYMEPRAEKGMFLHPDHRKPTRDAFNSQIIKDVGVVYYSLRNVDNEPELSLICARVEEKNSYAIFMFGPNMQTIESPCDELVAPYWDLLTTFKRKIGPSKFMFANRPGPSKNNNDFSYE